MIRVPPDQIADAVAADARRREAAAERVRRSRARRSRGMKTYRVVADEASIEDFLIEHGYLAANTADDHAAVEEALSQMIASMVRV